MKNTPKQILQILLFIGLALSGRNASAQKDTLHIYYLGLQTTVADSHEVKIGNWAKTLKGNKAYVEIITYYDNTNFKKAMAERAENLNLIVIRKARDYIDIKFTGPVKGKKSQRSVADIVYLSEKRASPTPSAPESSPATESSTEKESSSEKPKNDGEIKTPEESTNSVPVEERPITPEGKEQPKEETPKSPQD